MYLTYNSFSLELHKLGRTLPRVCPRRWYECHPIFPMHTTRLISFTAAVVSVLRLLSCLLFPHKMAMLQVAATTETVATTATLVAMAAVVVVP